MKKFRAILIALLALAVSVKAAASNKDQLAIKNSQLYMKLQNATLNLTAANIRAGDIPSAIESFQTLDDGSSRLKEITTKAYASSIPNAKNVLKFADSLKSFHDKAEVYDTLLNEFTGNAQMDLNYHVFELGHALKKIISSEDYPDMEESLKKSFTRLKSLLPQAVRYILWKEEVCLKSIHFPGEILGAGPNDVAMDEDHRNVFTWKTPPKTEAAQWIFEPDSTGRYFAIKNKLYGEYLYAPGNDLSYDNTRRRIFTWRSKSPFDAKEWEIQTVRNGTGIYIRNKDNLEYLYPVTHSGNLIDDNRRLIFSWRVVSDEPTNSTAYDWDVTDCQWDFGFVNVFVMYPFK